MSDASGEFADAVAAAKAENEARRRGIAAGLRDLAHWIEHEEFPVQGEGFGLPPYFEVSIGVSDKRELLERAARTIPGRKTKDVDSSFLSLKAEPYPGFKIDVWGAREAVCEAKVVGTEPEEVEVPVSVEERLAALLSDASPEARASLIEAFNTIPTTRTETRERDVIEYDCGPVLRRETAIVGD